MRRVIAWTLLAGAVVVLAGAAPAAAPSPEAVLRLEPYRSTVALRAKVAGTDGFFVFDTGGGLTSITPAFAEKIGCKPWGRLTGFQMMGQRLDTTRCDDAQVRVGPLSLGPRTLSVLDVMSLFPKDAAPVDGLLALDLFDGKAITVDFPGATLTVESPASLRERVAKMTPVPARLAREVQGRALAVSAGVPSPRGPIWMEIDSGNGGTILVSKAYATLFGLDPAREGPQEASFDIAPGLHVEGRAFTPDMILDGNIGMPFLKGVVVTVDLREGRMWMARPAR